MKADGACENCRWWAAERAHIVEMPIGTCRASPPSEAEPLEVTSRHGAAVRIVSRGRWYWTASDDWCAGFKRRESALEAEPDPALHEVASRRIG